MNRTKIIGIIGVLIVSVAGYLVFVKKETPQNAGSQTTATSSSTTNFIKEGEIVFLRQGTGERIKKIDVEIADNDGERSKGLMYRSAMADSLGMLFIFTNAEPQSFWMKNTYISLDILYVDENKKIVTIQKNTKPLSEESIPSYRNAQYVIEVNGGFCEHYGIKEGDTAQF